MNIQHVQIENLFSSQNKQLPQHSKEILQEQICEIILNHNLNRSVERTKFNYLIKQIDHFSKKDVKILIQQVTQKIKEKDLSLQETIYSDLANGINKNKISKKFPLPLRIQIAKLAAIKDGYELAKEIDLYLIDTTTKEGREGMIEIAKIAAKQNGKDLSLHIDKYKINSLIKLIEIAKIAANQNGEATSIYIKNFHIDPSTKEGREGLIEIARIAVQKAGPEVLNWLEYYGIDKNSKEGLKIFLEFCRIAALQDGMITSVFIQNCLNYSNIDPMKIHTELIAILKLSTRQYGQDLSHYYPLNLDLEELKSLKKYFDVYKTYRVLQSFTTVEELPQEILNERITRAEEICGVDKNKQVQNIAEKLKQFYKNFWLESSIKDPFLNLIQSVVDLKKTKGMKEEEHRRVQFQQLNFLLRALADMHLGAISLDELSTVFLPILSTELKLRDPTLRNQIWDFLFENNLSIQEKIVSTEKKSHIHALLPNILLTILQKNGHSDETIQDAIRISKSGSETYIFKDAFANQVLLQTLITLHHEQTLSVESKQNLLKKALTLKTNQKPDKLQIIKALKRIKGIIDLGEGESLNENDKVSHDKFIQFLSDSHFEAFKKVIPICKSIVNFNEKFETTFGKFRNPGASAIEIYASTLNKGSSKEKQKTLLASGIFIQEMVEGQFPTCRYENSPHLTKIFSDNEGLEEKWKAGKKAPLSTFKTKQEGYTGWTIEDSDDPCDLFLIGTEIEGSCQRIDGDPSLNKCLLAYIMDGKNRALVIKNKEGKIQFRGVLRLLINTLTNRPTLFLERLYPKTISEEFQKVMMEFAVSRSQSLGLDLASTEVGKGDPIEGSIASTSSRAPYEYVDANNEVYNDGIYTIQRAHYLNRISNIAS